MCMCIIYMLFVKICWGELIMAKDKLLFLKILCKCLNIAVILSGFGADLCVCVCK